MLQSKAKWTDLDNSTEQILVKDIPLEVSPIIEKLLLQRGITTASEAKQFLSPDIEFLHGPESIKDIDKAAKRVQDAIAANEKILIYGDYDADGVTSTALMYKTLKELNADCDFYIPNRFTEGYGLNEQAIHAAKQNGFTLIITVDTGITAIHEANVAKLLGIDLIITDHHEPQKELPEVTAIIHPVLSEDYPFKELAGVGVAFKFSQYLLGYFPKQFLEYVAIGTIADLMPLKNENRILTHFGLTALSTSHTPGIQALKNKCNIEGNVSEEDVGFLMGPRLNAVGRLQDASLAVELLLTESLEEANYFAEEIDLLNQQRKQIVSQITEEAEKMADPEKHGMIIVANEGWNEGVLGIVASRLVQKFDRPAIVLNYNQETGLLKGSGRSIPAFDLFTNCMKVRDLFTNFGGHAQAAGMTIANENLAVLQESLDQLVAAELSPDDFKQEIIISGSIHLNEIDEHVIDEMNKLAPYGMGNPKPIFKIKKIPKDARQIGSKKNHLKLQFSEDGNNLDGIAFGMGELFHAISPNTALTVVGELGINEWNGKRKAQIMIQDMCIDEWQLFDYRGRKNCDLSLLKEENTLTVGHNPLHSYPHLQQIQYDTEVNALKEVDHLILFELPKHLDELKKIIQYTKPKNIYACYHIEKSAYLNRFPTREDFIWFYAVVKKQQVIDLKTEIQAMMQVKSWSREFIIFIAQVFSELNFVNIENGRVEINPHPDKRELEDSTIYQDRLQRLEIEQKLYYSNYQQFRNWFLDCMDYLDKPEEEIVNGL